MDTNYILWQGIQNRVRMAAQQLVNAFPEAREQNVAYVSMADEFCKSAAPKSDFDVIHRESAASILLQSIHAQWDQLELSRLLVWRMQHPIRRVVRRRFRRR
jgi:hypothetical protein